MVVRIFNNYKDSFRGLSNEVWWLALITFVNRAGTMVLPFLSLYLTEDLKFSLSQVGWVMTSFGLGSLLGSWLGGKLTDKIGFYKVMVGSMLTTGFLFIALQFIHTFEGFLASIFTTMVVADTFRPAMFVSLKAYSKPENRTRSLTLIRLAINLGFSLGPFLGGLIIAGIGYTGLFWIDGVTCILAIFLMLAVLKQKEIKALIVNEDIDEVVNSRSVYNDRPFWIFLGAVFLMGFLFLQLFSTMPLFYKEIHHLSEVQIGLLMSLNGLIIFLLEMPIIHYIEKKFLNKIKIIAWSLALFSFSFLVLNLSLWIGVLIIGMIFITVGEMLAFPFTNNFAMGRAPKGREGRYLALYAMSFSCAHIFSAKTGMEIIDRFGYSTNWYFMTFLGFVAVSLMLWLKKELIKEKEVSN